MRLLRKRLLAVAVIPAIMGCGSSAPSEADGDSGADAASAGAGGDGGVQDGSPEARPDSAVGDSAAADSASIQCLRGSNPTAECGCEAYGCLRVSGNYCNAGLVPLFCESDGTVHQGLSNCSNSYTDGTMCDAGFGVIYCCAVP